MKIILTHEGLTLNSKYIVAVQPVFVSAGNCDVIWNLTDETDYDDVEFGIIAVTTLGDEIILGSYATEEERDYAKYKLENWLTSDLVNCYKMTERK